MEFKRLTFISPPGLKRPFDSRLCWTPWSVLQDGSGGRPIHRRERLVTEAPCSDPRALPVPSRRRSSSRPTRGRAYQSGTAFGEGKPGARGVLLDSGEVNPRSGRAAGAGHRPCTSLCRVLSCQLFVCAAQPPPPAHGLNPPLVRPSRLHPFALLVVSRPLDSLFRVLFNFPSRYLSAIGLVVVFSLRWSLPPALGCSTKQPDSPVKVPPPAPPKPFSQAPPHGPFTLLWAAFKQRLRR